LIYEYREYHVLPGMMADLMRQFTTFVPPFFEKHGYKIVGAWEQMIGENDRFVYLLEWKDLAHREKSVNGLWSDPEWLKAFEEHRKPKGPAVKRIVNKIWKPVSFSPMK
jgi:hypothetical protein